MSSCNDVLIFILLLFCLFNIPFSSFLSCWFLLRFSSICKFEYLLFYIYCFMLNNLYHLCKFHIHLYLLSYYCSFFLFSYILAFSFKLKWFEPSFSCPLSFLYSFPSHLYVLNSFMLTLSLFPISNFVWFSLYIFLILQCSLPDSLDIPLCWLSCSISHLLILLISCKISILDFSF